MKASDINALTLGKVSQTEANQIAAELGQMIEALMQDVAYYPALASQQIEELANHGRQCIEDLLVNYNLNAVDDIECAQTAIHDMLELISQEIGAQIAKLGPVGHELLQEVQSALQGGDIPQFPNPNAPPPPTHVTPPPPTLTPTPQPPPPPSPPTTPPPPPQTALQSIQNLPTTSLLSAGWTPPPHGWTPQQYAGGIPNSVLMAPGYNTTQITGFVMSGWTPPGYQQSINNGNVSFTPIPKNTVPPPTVSGPAPATGIFPPSAGSSGPVQAVTTPPPASGQTQPSVVTPQPIDVNVNVSTPTPPTPTPWEQGTPYAPTGQGYTPSPQQPTIIQVQPAPVTVTCSCCGGQSILPEEMQAALGASGGMPFDPVQLKKLQEERKREVESQSCPLPGLRTDVFEGQHAFIQSLMPLWAGLKYCERVIDKGGGKGLFDTLVKWGVLNKDGEFAAARNASDDYCKKNGFADQWAAKLFNFVAGFFGSTFTIPSRLIDDIMIGIGCPGGVRVEALAVEAFLGYVGKWFSSPIEEWARPLAYARHYRCPTELPTQADANKAWGVGRLTDEQWECLTRANGNIVDQAKNVRNADNPKMGPTEIFEAWRRGFMTDEDLEKRLIAVGIIDPVERKQLRLMTNELPGIGDIIRFLIRDVADPSVVKDLNLDDQFEQKYQGKLREWGYGQGISDDLAKYFWRAHWIHPSPQQIYQMYQRLRPSRVEPELAVSLDDALRALEIDDWAPAWRKRLLSIAYHTITRTDARQAYIDNAIDRKEAVELMLDNGYSPDGTEQIVGIWDRRKLRQLINNRYIKLFIKYQFGEAETREILVEDGYGQQEIDYAIKRAKKLQKAETRGQCYRQLERDYAKGLETEEGARAALLRLGYGPVEVQAIIDRLNCMVKHSSKTVSATQSCRLRYLGIIDREQQLKILNRLGYSDEDAEYVAAECTYSNEDRAKREETKQKKNAMQTFDKLIRDLGKLVRQVQQGHK